MAGVVGFMINGFYCLILLLDGTDGSLIEYLSMKEGKIEGNMREHV